MLTVPVEAWIGNAAVVSRVALRGYPETGVGKRVDLLNS